MQLYLNPPRSSWPEILQRPTSDISTIKPKVQAILTQVKNQGDEALKELTAKFDGVELSNLQVTPEEFAAAEKLVSPNLKDAIIQAKINITKFHKAQREEEQIIEIQPGVECWRKSIPIQKVGLYIPGGSAPLFSTLLMLGIPAQIAGCKEIILCTPCDKNGIVNAAILWTAHILGITQVFKIGGAQAIGAMAFGTETIPQVYKIFGPGNQFVTVAKQLVQEDGIAIDMPAGPSEALVLADETANPTFLASDILAQTEHGPDCPSILITTSQQILEQTKVEIERQVQTLGRQEILQKSQNNIKLILVENLETAIDLANEYACEHVIIETQNPERVAEQIVNGGSIFIGPYSPEAAGDYCSGPNHTLPTNGFAKAYSGVSLDSFVKKITYQKLTKEGLQGLASTVKEMALGEGLDAHWNSVNVRLVE